ncbi:MAG: GNAT family N-acetyltransferase [Desulfobacteraceae bacterium]|nr:MAG: GNAT family N-acetyltransferase [Desulfobacteraceae bacterium]
MYELHEIDPQQALKWDELVYSFPNHTVFHTRKWLSLLEKNQSLTVTKIALYHQGHLVGLLPLSLKKILLMTIAASPFVVEDTPYMGILTERVHFSGFLKALTPFLKENKIHYFRMISNCFYEAGPDDNAFQWIPKYTHILDLTKSNRGLWDQLQSRCRTAIRKAEKSGVEIQEMGGRHEIEDYYAMIAQTYGNQRKPCPNPKGLYYDLWDAYDRNQVVFLHAKFKDETIAGMILLIDGKQAYYINGASKNEYKPLSASNLLLWRAITTAKEKDAEIFDFVGSDIPRLAKFKESFGGTLSRHTCLEKASSRRIYLLRNQYPKYKQVVGRLMRGLA